MHGNNGDNQGGLPWHYIAVFLITPILVILCCLIYILRDGELGAAIRRCMGRVRARITGSVAHNLRIGHRVEEGVRARPSGSRMPTRELAELVDEEPAVPIYVPHEPRVEEGVNVNGGATAGPSPKDEDDPSCTPLTLPVKFPSILSRFCGDNPRPLANRSRPLFMECFDPDNASASIPARIYLDHIRAINASVRGGSSTTHSLPLRANKEPVPVVHVPVPNNTTSSDMREIYCRGIFGSPCGLLGMLTSGRLRSGTTALYLPVFSSGDHSNSGAHFEQAASVLSEIFECDDDGQPNSCLLSYLRLSGVVFCVQDSKEPGVDNTALFQAKLSECSAARNARIQTEGRKCDTIRFDQFYTPAWTALSPLLSPKVLSAEDLGASPSQPGTPLFSPQGSIRSMFSTRIRPSLLTMFSEGGLGTSSSQPGTPVLSPQGSIRSMLPQRGRSPLLKIFSVGEVDASPSQPGTPVLSPQPSIRSMISPKARPSVRRVSSVPGIRRPGSAEASLSSSKEGSTHSVKASGKRKAKRRVYHGEGDEGSVELLAITSRAKEPEYKMEEVVQIESLTREHQESMGRDT